MSASKESVKKAVGVASNNVQHFAVNLKEE
jgi:hypothetical protein